MKVLYGPTIGQASGSLGGMVASHNRYGTYMRRRAHPIISQSEEAVAAKARLSALSKEWANVALASREAWATWAANTPIIDRLGQQQVLAGNAAYNLVNGRRAAIGAASLAVPPVDPAPAGLTSAALTADIGAGDFQVVFAGTPLAALTRIWCQVAVTTSSSQKYVKNKLKFIGLSAAAQASPFDAIAIPAAIAGTLKASIEARFGTLAVGNLVTLYLSVYSETTGLVSRPIICSAEVTTT